MSTSLLAMRVCEAMFFIGLIGSAVVIAISFVQDGKELLARE
jgi:hypothetical protein